MRLCGLVLVSLVACGGDNVIQNTPDASGADAAEHDASVIDAKPDVDAAPPADLGTTDGTVASGWYCGKDAALKAHIATWNAPALMNDDNLFYVGLSTNKIDIVGYCTGGCVSGSGGHDHCTAPNGTPINGQECFAGVGKYCGHVLGIEARSYPASKIDKEGLFDCAGKTDVSLVSDCACQVTPGGADSCVTGAGRRLWIAYESNTTTCVSELQSFWDCMFNHASFDDFVNAYGTGYTLTWGGAAQIPASCGTDYQCAVDNAKFAVTELDVVVIMVSAGAGGQNTWDPVVVVGGKSVHIHGAHVGDASGSCDMQTAYTMHEVYEATTDPGAADCCDGEVPYTPSGASGCLAWNSACSIACQKWGPAACGGNGSYGLATIKCPGGTFMYQTLSPATDEYGQKTNQCLPITVTH